MKIEYISSKERIIIAQIGKKLFYREEGESLDAFKLRVSEYLANLGDLKRSEVNGM